MAKENKYMLIHGDPKLWHRVKIMVAIKGTTIKAVIMAALIDAVDKFEGR